MSTRARLFPPVMAAPVPEVRWESQEIVRRRLFPVRTADDLTAVVKRLEQERAVGKISLHLGPGGIAQTLEFEERKKLPA